jgi:MraZ protein
MFQGHSTINIDDKGRIIVPAKFRRHITPEANNIINATLGRDSCVWLFPSHEWTKLLQTLDKVNSYTKDEVAMKRHMLFYADECTLDSQHRILIPQQLLQIVNIKKEVLLIGQLERIELWNPENYEKYLKGSTDTYEDVMEKVMSKISFGGGQ